MVIKNLSSGNVPTLVELSDNVDSHITWSPNGKKILYHDSSNELYTIWPDGSHRAVISDGESDDGSWSSDGTKLIFTMSRREGNAPIADIFSLNISGEETRPTKLTSDVVVRQVLERYL